MSFKVRYLVAAIAATYPVVHVHAAGMDRTGQDIKGFFNEGVYAEMDYVHISTKISGHDNAENNGISHLNKYQVGRSTGNLTPHDYNFFRYGVKADVTDNISVGVFYDKPWGAKVEITGDNAFVTSKDGSEKTNVNEQFTLPNQVINENAKASNTDYNRNTHVEVDSQSLTGIVGYKMGGVQVYGGPVIQKVHADLSLRGQAYGPITGYDAVVNEDTAVGWLAGVSYSKPEIMLNAALTYRSPIEHKAPVAETIPILGSTLKEQVANLIEQNTGEKVDRNLLRPHVTNDAKVTTPESVNLNLQTGLSRKHQLMGFVNARWVPWSKFKIVPPAYNVVSKASTGKNSKGLPLLDYDKDGWQVEVGLGKRVNERLAVSGVVGWDSGAGDPVSSLGPVNGYWSVGGGARYNITPEWSVSAGGKYMKFGNAKAKLPNDSVVGNFSDNDGYVVGVKLAYHQR